MPQGRRDVVVVGAGLAGLSAAQRLEGAGLRVLVLEARSEVGGRTRSREVGGKVADLGGEWVGRAHRRVRRRVAELGLTLQPARNIGHPILWRLPSGESMGRLPPAGIRLELARLFGRAAWISRGVDPAGPWNAARADELDRVSVAEWLQALSTSEDVAHLLDRLVGSLSSSPLNRVSLLHFVWWMRLAGDPIRSLYTTFQWRIAEGAQEISHRLASNPRIEVRTDSPVRSVSRNGRVQIETDTGEDYEAERVVIAVPANLAAGIRFDPPLPEAQQALSELRIGPGTKVIALLPPGHGVRHNTVLGGQRLWGAWREGDRITGFAPPSQSEHSDETLAADLAGAFGVEPAALRQPTVFRWADEPRIQGCDLAFAPGEVRRHGPVLGMADDRVHFAGVERSSWPNNMEGALESGECAADEVLRSLVAAP